MSSGESVDGSLRLVRSIVVALGLVVALGGGIWALDQALRPPPPSGGGAASATPGGDGGSPSGPDPRLVASLERLAREHARDGRPDGPVRRGRLAATKSTSLSESVAANRCYGWMGASPEGTDLDLFLRQGGEVVSQDKRPDNTPVVQHCVGAADTLELEVKMYEGGGPWAVQRHAYRGAPGADQLELLHGLYGKRVVKGAEPLWALRRMPLREKQKALVKLSLEPEWCYVALAVSLPGTDVDLYLLDPEGRVVGEDDSHDNWPVIRHCPATAATYKLRLLMFEGDSEIAFRVYRHRLAD